MPATDPPSATRSAQPPDSSPKRLFNRGALALFPILFAGGAFYWVRRLWIYFPRNEPAADAGVVGAYALGYGLVTGLIGWAVFWVVARLVPPLGKACGSWGRWFGDGSTRARILGVLLGLLPLLAVAFLARARYRLAQAANFSAPLQVNLTWGPSRYRIQLIGIDGADLRQLTRLIEEGALPNLARVMKEGVSGPMETISPHSPVIWTSVATGQGPLKHRIGQFQSSYLRGTSITIPQNRRDLLGGWLDSLLGFRVEGAVSSNERAVRAVWEILSEFQLPSLVVNWWATFPAEPILGEMVSNHLVPWSGFQRDVMAEHMQSVGLTSPASLAPELLDLLDEYVEREGLMDVERNAFSVAGNKYYAARDELVFEIYRRRLAESQMRFAFASVYMQGVDTMSHAYTTVNFGKNRNEAREPLLESEEGRALWDRMVRDAYETMDRRVGQVLDDRSEDDIVIIVSDHGWEYDGTSHWNEPPGVFLAVGGPFLPGGRVQAHVFDVLPTMLQLLGLPLSEEFAGRVLDEALAPEWLAEHSVETLPTYGRRGAFLSVEPPDEDDSHMDRLRDLGYVK